MAKTKVDPVPKGMHTLTPSLVFRDCPKAIEYYKQALGAEEVARVMSPDGKVVWHAELRVGDSIFFLNDQMQGMGPPPPTPASPVPLGLWLYVPDADAAHARAVKAGATSTMEPSDMFWGDRMSAVIDPFGYAWSFATRLKEVGAEELKRAGEAFARGWEERARQGQGGAGAA